jgi:2-succinyl-5-enolpyruvyl-6-hydroxy-3-cyclohexene-1-carboxylate synthase
MTSDKKGAALLAELFVKNGFETIVISPGSRNAPLVLSFAQHPEIDALSIVDERSAAYFALGIAQQTKKAVALTCTSGGAALNYAPAIAEAYYQQVPLLVITADRPERLIDQGDGQTIRQQNIYANYIKQSFHIPGEIEDDESLQNAARTIQEALELTTTPGGGPVHINMPFEEPIYNQVETSFDVPFPEIINKQSVESVSKEKISELAEVWNSKKRKLLIAGMLDPNPVLRDSLLKITTDPSVVLLTETTSNLTGLRSVNCIDRVVHTFKQDELKRFQPDLLVTFGGNVISKMVKAYLRDHAPAVHWNIDPVNPGMNTYFSLTDPLSTDPASFFEGLSEWVRPADSDYAQIWMERADRSETRHAGFLKETGYCDLKVFELLLESIPKESQIQLGNSTPVRYAQLFRNTNFFSFYSNRGTSGIDGVVSTAAGAAYASEEHTILITGDLGFLYDSNALMNHHLTGRLRIIVLNNGGGGIFRFIPGPDQTDQLEEFFEAHHRWKAEFIARNFNVPYYSACNTKELKTMLPDFYKEQPGNRPAILEIFTPHKKNARILKDYFRFLKE